MVFNATFNKILVISWRSILLAEETGGPRENYRPVASHWQTLLHNVVHLAPIEIRTHNISGDIGTDRIGNCKSNYHTIMPRRPLSLLKTLLWLKCRIVINKMNCELMLTCDTPAYMFNVYKNQLSRQTGSRNLDGSKNISHNMAYIYEACDQISDFCHQ